MLEDFYRYAFVYFDLYLTSNEIVLNCNFFDTKYPVKKLCNYHEVKHNCVQLFCIFYELDYNFFYAKMHFLDVIPCYGKDLPLVNSTTGLEYNCGEKGGKCPLGSFCHHMQNFAKCCPKGRIFLKFKNA